MKNIYMISLLVITILFLASCNQSNNKAHTPNSKTETAATADSQINAMLNAFHQKAAVADFDQYFSHFSDDAVFMGTDATEYWSKDSFMIWSKPYFDAGKAWNFSALDRHIFLDTTGNLAWFDELLHTQMKICRGSGVVVKTGNEWKIKQYVLSMTIPNSLVDSIVLMKTPMEDVLINSFK